eukprot:1894495-Rhodomonas_salina.1
MPGARHACYPGTRVGIPTPFALAKFSETSDSKFPNSKKILKFESDTGEISWLRGLPCVGRQPCKLGRYPGTRVPGYPVNNGYPAPCSGKTELTRASGADDEVAAQQS